MGHGDTLYPRGIVEALFSAKLSWGKIILNKFTLRCKCNFFGPFILNHFICDPKEIPLSWYLQEGHETVRPTS